MPLTHWICPDRKESSIEDCLNECRMAEGLETKRCLSKRTLRAMSEQRVWNGTPSVTQLLNGTREEYLKIKKDFSINPQNRVFALFGTQVHNTLETTIGDTGVSEERITLKNVSGAFDNYEDNILYDVKTYGSYAVAKTLGIKPVYVYDGVYKTGDKAGQSKFKKNFLSTNVKSRFNLAVQLNSYRMMLESIGKPVDQMLCEVIVRDAGTQTAIERGVMHKAMLIPINKISDHWVERFISAKRDRLIEAIKTDIMPPACSHRESWGGRKCKSYCDVYKQCDVSHKKKKGSV